MFSRYETLGALIIINHSVTIHTYEGLPRWPSGKELACNAGDVVQSLGQEDPLEKGMTTHSSILA